MTREDEAEPGRSKQKDQSTQTQDLSPKRGAASAAGKPFGYETPDTDQKIGLCTLWHKPVPTSDSNTTKLFSGGCRVYGREAKTSRQALQVNLRLKRQSRLLPAARRGIKTQKCIVSRSQNTQHPAGNTAHVELPGVHRKSTFRDRDGYRDVLCQETVVMWHSPRQRLAVVKEGREEEPPSTLESVDRLLPQRLELDSTELQVGRAHRHDHGSLAGTWA